MLSLPYLYPCMQRRFIQSSAYQGNAMRFQFFCIAPYVTVLMVLCGSFVVPRRDAELIVLFPAHAPKSGSRHGAGIIGYALAPVLRLAVHNHILSVVIFLPRKIMVALHIVSAVARQWQQSRSLWITFMTGRSIITRKVHGYPVPCVWRYQAL